MLILRDKNNIEIGNLCVHLFVFFGHCVCEWAIFYLENSSERKVGSHLLVSVQTNKNGTNASETVLLIPDEEY